MPASLRTLFALCIVGLMVGGPWAYKTYRDRRSRNFHVVRDGVLYRSGQLNVPGLDRLRKEYGIRTVVSLRDGERADEQAEEAWAGKYYVKFLRLPPKPWHNRNGGGPIPAEENLAKFRQVLADPDNYPVLVHCQGGIHRTGAFCAVYRMDCEGWTNQEAMAEMRSLRYTMLDEHEDLLEFLVKYRPTPIAARGVPARPVLRTRSGGSRRPTAA